MDHPIHRKPKQNDGWLAPGHSAATPVFMLMWRLKINFLRNYRNLVQLEIYRDHCLVSLPQQTAEYATVTVNIMKNFPTVAGWLQYTGGLPTHLNQFTTDPHRYRTALYGIPKLPAGQKQAPIFTGTTNQF